MKINQEKQSKAAVKRGVCHTEEECKQMYNSLTPELKAPALKLLAEELSPAKADIQKAYATKGKNWWVDHHLFWGMSVRNFLREKGFGEEYFKVHNLDDIYIALVEEALELNA